jgi:hypothetical protein
MDQLDVVDLTLQLRLHKKLMYHICRKFSQINICVYIYIYIYEEIH